jgi:hypothetical protein
MTRIEKYAEFEKFWNAAKEIFNALKDEDPRANRYSKMFSFYSVPGGAMGGTDQTLVEVFFGQRPLYQTKTLEPNAQGLPERRTNTQTERGAYLRYQRTDAGRVICTLHPAITKNLGIDLVPREDFIVLDVISNPSSLFAKALQKSHWRAFISYMECTNVDGEPNVLDKIRVSYLRFIKTLGMDQRLQEKRIWAASGAIVRFALTVGLSGFLLTLIAYFGSSRKAQEAETQHWATLRELAEAKVVIAAQGERVQSLEAQLQGVQRSIIQMTNVPPLRPPRVESNWRFTVVKDLGEIKGLISAQSQRMETLELRLDAALQHILLATNLAKEKTEPLHPQ